MREFNKGNIKGLVAAFALLGMVAQAQAADQELLDILLGNGAINQQQYDALLAKESLSKSDVAVISLGNGGGLNISTADGGTEVEIGGRLQMDYVDHSYDSRMGIAPISGTQIRRGRIEMDGTFNTNWIWAAEFDYAKNGVAIKDFTVGYATDKGTRIMVGHQKQPYNLELEMSSNDLPFVERGVDNFLVAAFTDRALGLRVQSNGDHWFVAGGLFGDTLKTGGAGDEGWGVTGRAIYSPVVAADKVVHLGLRASYREIDASTPVVSIKDKTSDFSELSIVNTGALANAENVTLSGPEFAIAYGPLFMFGEYNNVELDRTAASTLEFNSWHVGATWALTGESRAARYRMSDGEFKNIRPTRNYEFGSGNPGAWELAARFASISLNDGLFIGGEEDAASLSLNWYPNRNVRFLLDWTRILDTDGSNTVRTFAPDMDILTFRSQYNF